MLKPYQRFSAEQFYEELIAELSSGRPDSKKPSSAETDPARSRLRDYAARSRELDTLLTRLGAKEFCATRCDRSPGGCCWEHTYRMGNEDYFELLALQEVEARRRGWRRPGRPCRYHTNNGCRLWLFKTPVCLRLLCPRLAKSLERKYGKGARDFGDALAKLSLDIQRSPNLLKEMDRAIAAGRKLLAP
jgi:hypothetical protein